LAIHGIGHAQHVRVPLGYISSALPRTFCATANQTFPARDVERPGVRVLIRFRFGGVRMSTSAAAIPGTSTMKQRLGQINLENPSRFLFLT
jgi:hypothetical protein